MNTEKTGTEIWLKLFAYGRDEKWIKLGQRLAAKKKYTGITKYYLKFTTFVLFNKKLLITQ